MYNTCNGICIVYSYSKEVLACEDEEYQINAIFSY